MKIYKGRQKVARYKNFIDLVIDFDDLFFYKGNRRFRYALDKNIGYLFMVLGLSIIAFGLYLFYLRGQELMPSLINPVDFADVIPWIGVFIFIYGFYLRRSREEFDFNFEKTDLRKYRTPIAEGKIKEMEIDNFFTGFTSGILDEAYYKDSEDFIFYISKEIFKEKDLLEIIDRRFCVPINEFITKALQESRVKSFTNVYQNLFLHLFGLAIELDFSHITREVLFMVLAKEYWAQTLLDFDLQEAQIFAISKWIGNESKKKEYRKQWRILSKLKPTGAINRAFTSRSTPMLDEFGDDFTSNAAKGEFVVTIGKDLPLQNLLETLSSETGGAAMIIGDTGVGKTSLLKHLATRMVVEDVPDNLKDLRLVVVDLNRVMAKSTSLDDFQLKLSELLEEVRLSGNILLAFEEVGQIFLARDEARGEVIGLLGNIIRDEKMKVIATATTDHYNRHIKVTKSFASIFDVIEIPQPDTDITFQIVMDEVPKFEKAYQMRVQTNAVQEVVAVAPKIIYEKAMPDKAIDLLEEAMINAQAFHTKYLDMEMVDRLFKEKIGVEVGKLSTNESEMLLNLEKEMHKRVVGQEMAVRAVSAALRRARSGLQSGKRPIANFMFYGPTGVGKTEIAKALAEIYFGDEKRMIRLNMSEFQDSENVDRLIGFFDNEGNFVDGVLTSQIKTNPFSLLLLDELEKANKKVLDLFLQVFDDGYLNDAAGSKVDFTNTIIIATSNVGSKDIAELLNKGKNYREIEATTKPLLSNYYRVEFLNRFDKVIMFSSLSKVEVEKIADILMKGLASRLEEKGISLHWDKETLMALSSIGHSQIFGARELRRVIQDNIEDKVATLMISGRVKSGNNVYFHNLEVSKID